MSDWEFSPKARREMAAIWRYTADHWGEDQAERYVRQIEHDLTAAAAGSPLARPFEGCLRIKSGSHVCVFKHEFDGKVIVLRVLHQSQDIPARLRD
jgi:toxin ParE1/3/4